MDFRRCLEVQTPYLGPVIGAYTDWTPLTDRPGLFLAELDERDPWQFKNFLVRCRERQQRTCYGRPQGPPVFVSASTGRRYFGGSGLLSGGFFGGSPFGGGGV